MRQRAAGRVYCKGGSVGRSYGDVFGGFLQRSRNGLRFTRDEQCAAGEQRADDFKDDDRRLTSGAEQTAAPIATVISPEEIQ